MFEREESVSDCHFYYCNNIFNHGKVDYSCFTGRNNFWQQIEIACDTMS